MASAKVDIEVLKRGQVTTPSSSGVEKGSVEGQKGHITPGAKLAYV